MSTPGRFSHPASVSVPGNLPSHRTHDHTHPCTCFSISTETLSVFIQERMGRKHCESEFCALGFPPLTSRRGYGLFLTGHRCWGAINIMFVAQARCDPRTVHRLQLWWRATSTQKSRSFTDACLSLGCSQCAGVSSNYASFIMASEWNIHKYSTVCIIYTVYYSKQIIMQ